MTIAQACAEYRIGRTTLYEALNEGSLPARILRKRGTRIRRGDLELWIASLPLYKPTRTPAPSGFAPNYTIDRPNHTVTLGRYHVAMAATITAAFFNRDVDTVASSLIGAGLTFNRVGGIIVETESYDPDDPASHSFPNRPTARTAVMFGAAAHAHVYRSYGIHWCLNFVCRQGSAVLIRAIAPRHGLDLMQSRRGDAPQHKLCSGPGNVCAALGITGAQNGSPLLKPPFRLVQRDVAVDICTGARIGISKAAHAVRRYGGELAIAEPLFRVSTMTERDLFGDPALPDGFEYRPGVLSPAEERRLVAKFEQLSFQPFDFHGFVGKRRIVSYGYRYDFVARRVWESAPIPSFLESLRHRAGDLAGLAPEAFEQILITEYAAGAGIGWHKDKREFGQVVAVSFVSRRHARSGSGGKQRVLGNGEV